LQSIDALEEQFHLLEEEVATLVADVHDLALYTKLNITGFMKILKVRHPIISMGPLIHHHCQTVETRCTRPCSIHVYFSLDPVYTPCRSKPRTHLPRHSFRIISRSALFISITGMQSSSNSLGCMTLFGRAVTPYRVTPLPAGPRVRSYGRQQNTGYTLITSFRSNSPSCDTSLFSVAIYLLLNGLTPSKLTMLQYSIRTRSLSPRTRL
jgi:hypothetical protein